MQYISNRSRKLIHIENNPFQNKYMFKLPIAILVNGHVYAGALERIVQTIFFQNICENVSIK